MREGETGRGREMKKIAGRVEFGSPKSSYHMPA